MIGYKTIVTKVIVVPEKEKDGAIFSEMATSLEISDEGAGPFIIVSQCGNYSGIRFEKSELSPVVDAAIKLITDYENATA